jgi:rhamnose transport system permease protein
MLKHHGREVSVALAILLLTIVLPFTTDGYFSQENLTDMFLANMPVLIVSIGATLVILTGEIDISVGSVFAICGVVAGLVAKLGVPTAWAGLAACLVGAALGAATGTLVAYGKVPSIVVTLAAMVALRDALRWATQGAWVTDLPPGFQWLGLTQSSFPVVMGVLAALVLTAIAWGMRNVAAGRAIYATGSNPDAARLAGIHTSLVKFAVFVAGGTLTGAAALLNSVRFNQIPPNAGLGLEMKVIASVVVGGTAITGGQGTLAGTLLGVVLLGAIGPALTFLGVNAYWERAIQGGIILMAVAVDALRGSGEPIRYPRAIHLARV